MVGQLLAPKFFILYGWLASVLYVHFRGKKRLSLWRQLTTYSALMAPYSALMYLFTSVSKRPIFSTDQMPDLAPLLEGWEDIRDEAANLYDQSHIQAAPGYNEIAFSSFFRRGWKRFYLKWYDDFLPSAAELCPKTVELVRSIPSLNAAMFTVMSPHSKLTSHRDPFAGSLRLHLGLKTPNSDDCRIFVDGEPYSWRDGEGIMFDQTFIHRAENKTDENRIILLCDVARPLNNPIVRGINRFFSRYLVKYTAPANDQNSDKLGIVNRLSKYIYRFRGFAKSVKKNHRGVYYGLSHTLKAVAVGGVLYFLFFRGTL